MMKYSIYIQWIEPFQKFKLQIPECKGFEVLGETYEEAIENAKKRFPEWCETMKKARRGVPEPDILKHFNGFC